MAVCYHLHHQLLGRQCEAANFTVYTTVLQNGIKRCKKGYNNYQKEKEGSSLRLVY